MKEINAVSFRLKSEMPKLSIDAEQALHDAFWRFSDIYGIPETCNRVLALVESVLDEIMTCEDSCCL